MKEKFPVLFDVKSFYISYSKVSLFASIQNLSLFTILLETFSNISFFITLIASILSFKSAILLTLVFMYPRRKKNQVALNLESVMPRKFGPLLLIHLSLNFSFNHVQTFLEKWNGTPSCYKVILLRPLYNKIKMVFNI